jgi:hypothetical protein
MEIPLRIRFPEIGARNPGRDAKEQVGMTIIKRDSATMGHFHVCDDSAVPCDDPEDQMVVADTQRHTSARASSVAWASALGTPSCASHLGRGRTRRSRCQSHNSQGSLPLQGLIQPLLLLHRQVTCICSSNNSAFQEDRGVSEGFSAELPRDITC